LSFRAKQSCNAADKVHEARLSISDPFAAALE
jgi:hypothetical protein